MNYIKKIAGKLRGYYIAKGVGLSALAALLLQGMMIRSDVMTGYLNILIFWGIATVAAIVLGLLVSLRKILTLKRQIRHQEAGVDFNNDHFIECAKKLWIGRDWLVYEDGMDYRIYNRASIRRIQVDGKRRGSLVRILCTEGTEGFTVNGNSTELQSRLDEWMKKPQ